jgi:hypothetical protein
VTGRRAGTAVLIFRIGFKKKLLKENQMDLKMFKCEKKLLKENQLDLKMFKCENILLKKNQLVVIF